MKYDIEKILGERILILDGALGTMVQGYGLTEADFRGDRFTDWPSPLAGCNDVLVLTRPDVIGEIHRAYLKAGADIISTDSFNANLFSLADYGLEQYSYEINRCSALLARGIADEITLSNPHKPRFVAGSIGPTSKTASMSSDVSDPGARQVTFDELVAAYTEQLRGLLDGGADILLCETIFDTLNAKACIFAIGQEFDRRGTRVPVMLSVTLADASGRTLSGQTVEAFYASIAHAAPLSIGMNCSYGAAQMRPYLERLASISEYAVSAHPNAGLPNIMGGYDETPQMMAADIEEYLKAGIVNIIGGCCGTTPVHIAEIARVVAEYQPRKVPAGGRQTVLSGLEVLRIVAESNFINIGERANVAGSARFARMIRDNDLEGAVAVARQQVESGAQIVDVCMDDGLIDGVQAMTSFLNLAMSEPEISRVPVMVDSSSWEVLEAGLKCVQGKCIVNSISLKEGPEEFLRKARLVRKYGAAAVVMLFDETGQADTFDRKIEVARRGYDILVADGFPAEDIVFDPNVLAVATGIEQHDNYGVDFIEACRWIKRNLPHAKVSGGISNLSFAYRGINKVREAMHSVFLYHAIAAGLDMAIVNPGMLQIYSEIEPELLQLAEDVVLNRRPDATERLSAYADKVRTAGDGAAKEVAAAAWREEPLPSRVRYAMTKGIADFIEDDALEAYNVTKDPLAVIDTMLMPAMEEIGVLFGEGKMFLPQVVKSARVMKKAVGVLTPYIEQGRQSGSKSAGKILIATVKGDVHDIGKNIVSVVMACNGYQVTDLGVMVETNTIVDKAQEIDADVIGLSGLISPSLDEMIKVVGELDRRGLRTPVIIGGATTSQLHTAVKIAPSYGGPVVHSRDASENITLLGKLLGPDRESFLREHYRRQESLRVQYEGRSTDNTVPLEKARSKRRVKKQADAVVPRRTGRVVFKDYPIRNVIPYIDWNFFFPAWEIKGRWPDLLDSPDKGPEARKLMRDAGLMLERMADDKLISLNGIVALYPAVSEGDDIVVDLDGTPVRLPQLRSQEARGDYNLSLADYVVSAEEGGGDHVGLFVVTAGTGLDRLTREYREAGDDYNAIMAKLLADRLAEAFAERLHHFVRTDMWGFEQEGELSMETILAAGYKGIRPAFGYPACPDHSTKADVMRLLDPERDIPVNLTENYMLDPAESVCGLIFAGEDERYFGIGKIDRQQLDDYAQRRGMDAAEISKLMSQHLK